MTPKPRTTLRTLLMRISRAIDSQRPVLTIPQACRLLQLSDKDGEAWLQEHQVIVEVHGQRRVVRDDVVDVLRRQAVTVRTKPRGKRALSWDAIGRKLAS